MSHSITLESCQLLCRTRRHASTAARRIATHAWMNQQMHVSLRLSDLPKGAPAWQLVVEYFDGSAWNFASAHDAFSRLSDCLCDGSFVAIRTEQGERFRYRWQYGALCFDEAVVTIWRPYSLHTPFPDLITPELAPKASPASKLSPRSPK